MSKPTPPVPRTRPIEVLRGTIDSIDREILQLLARRMSVVTEVASYKRENVKRIRDLSREREILDDRRRRAERVGLSADVVESIFRLVMWASRDYQASLRAEVPLDMEPKTVCVIGGQGGMGTRMARLFEDLGHTVLISDRDTALRPEDAAAHSDVTVVSVPIEITEEVIRQVGPHVPAHGLLMDVTSIKQAPLKAMLDACSASVLGTHPMFGPGVHSLQGQRVVLCAGRGDEWADWARKLFGARGLVITEATAQEHDRAMAIVQVLVHFQKQVLGLTLKGMGTPLSESLRFTSPAYLMELYIAARHFGQDPELYGPIEMLNPELNQVTGAFADAAKRMTEILHQGDQQAFDEVFAEVRDFFGDFSQEATEQGSFMMDRLVERS